MRDYLIIFVGDYGYIIGSYKAKANSKNDALNMLCNELANKKKLRDILQKTNEIRILER